MLPSAFKSMTGFPVNDWFSIFLTFFRQMTWLVFQQTTAFPSFWRFHENVLLLLRSTFSSHESQILPSHDCVYICSSPDHPGVANYVTASCSILLVPIMYKQLVVVYKEIWWYVIRYAPMPSGKQNQPINWCGSLHAWLPRLPMVWESSSAVISSIMPAIPE